MKSSIRSENRFFKAALNLSEKEPFVALLFVRFEDLL